MILIPRRYLIWILAQSLVPYCICSARSVTRCWEGVFSPNSLWRLKSDCTITSSCNWSARRLASRRRGSYQKNGIGLPRRRWSAIDRWRNWRLPFRDVGKVGWSAWRELSVTSNDSEPIKYRGFLAHSFRRGATWEWQVAETSSPIGMEAGSAETWLDVTLSFWSLVTCILLTLNIRVLLYLIFWSDSNPLGHDWNWLLARFFREWRH